MWFGRHKTTVPSPDEALRGRSARTFHLGGRHSVLETAIEPPYPDGLAVAVFGMGCFWGAERIFWQLPGVWTTAVGYAGGHTPHPTYDEVCSGRTGHTEAVQVVFDPTLVRYADLLTAFWESHDPTQGMRQGNDVGTQYRSAIYATDAAQLKAAEQTRDAYQSVLATAGYESISTEIAPAGPFYFAEDYHQQYLAKVPNGYCGIGGTGLSCPTAGVSADGEQVAARPVGGHLTGASDGA